ncbi:protein of unknown function [Roseateles sp. YR242]|uniref:DUF4124 domain-containing protein n=1 Tax=Roseateles sp. YR242 TaxID=1855305 RepID=UPI0008C7EE2F|nr:DUF4124 domain-containing protein [Roseateles sp. YR242]SEK30364.1 protein of unknown function [Roseateles sp. YR242]
MISKSLPLSLLCGLVLLSLAPVAQAQWKWRDADGRVQYSDRPPPGNVAEKDILGRPSASALRAMNAPAKPASAPASAAAPVAQSASDAAARQKAEKERKAADDKARAEMDAENCKQAQNQMRLLESGVRIAVKNDKGEREMVDDSARQTQMKQAQTVISVSCK